jgi:AcrR family transcriptional regulator
MSPRTAAVGSFFREVEPGRKGEILEAAMSVFTERGYDGGSMREIASRVGVTEPALYRHFSGKEAIFLALMDAVSGRLRDEAFGLIASVRPETLRPQLVAAFADRRRAVRVFGPMLRTVLSAASHNPRILAEYRGSMLNPVRDQLVAKAADLDTAFAAPPHAGDTRDDRVRALMALFIGYLVSTLVMADAPDEAVADAAIRLMGWEGAVRK